MSEPLTKDKIITSKEIEDQGGNFKFLELKDLKSALKYFEYLIQIQVEDIEVEAGLELALRIMKETFPAVYEVDK